MFNIVYKSLAPPNFSLKEIRELLDSARIFNDSCEITGCLIYFSGLFIQYLEGDQDRVLNLFEKIKKDDRHSEVSLLSSSIIYTREFDTWSMAYLDVTGPNEDLTYLKLMTDSCGDIEDMACISNPTSKKFWMSVKKLLNTSST